MSHLRSVALAVVLLVTMVGTVTSQDPAPAGAFKAVHLVSLTPQQVAALQAWMADMNATIDKAGHKDIRYRLYKVIGKQDGKVRAHVGVFMAQRRRLQQDPRQSRVEGSLRQASWDPRALEGRDLQPVRRSDAREALAAAASHSPAA